MLARMLPTVAALLIAAALPAVAGVAEAQDLGEVFRKVNASVVVIRAKGSDVENSGGLTRSTETGSGVLISADGKVMMAAHVMHTMDQVNVALLGGEPVPARVVSLEPAADLSLLHLQRPPPEPGWPPWPTLTVCGLVTRW